MIGQSMLLWKRTLFSDLWRVRKTYGDTKHYGRGIMLAFKA